MYNRRKSIGTGESVRDEFFYTPTIRYTQNNNPINNGFFNFNRAGLDYFIDNRNTITLAGNFVQGKFGNTDLLSIQTDTLFASGAKTIF